MSYIDVPDMAVEYLRGLGYADTHLKRLDAMTGREGIVVRRIPSTVTAREYGKRQQVSYLYQVIVRNRSERRAMELADELCRALDTAEIESGNGSYEFVAQEVYTPPQELTLDEAGFFAHEFRIRAYIVV